jgi:hypothetical protein
VTIYRYSLVLSHAVPSTVWRSLRKGKSTVWNSDHNCHFIDELSRLTGVYGAEGFNLSDMGLSRRWLWITPSSMLWHVALIRTDVSEEGIISIFTVTRIGELRTTLAATSNRGSVLATANVVLSSLILVTLMMETIPSSETSVLTRATCHNILEDGVLYLNTSSLTPAHCHNLCLQGWCYWKLANSSLCVCTRN